jgi:hypothetical protein
MSKFDKGDKVLYAKANPDIQRIDKALLGKIGKVRGYHSDMRVEVEFITDAALKISTIRLIDESNLLYLQTFKVGDYIQLKDKDRHPREEANFSLQEGLELNTGYQVAKISTPDNDGVEWISIFKNGIWHYPDKFNRWVPTAPLPFKQFDLVKINKPGSKHNGHIVKIVTLPEDGEEFVLVADFKNNFFKYRPDLLSLIWEYQEFAKGDKVTIASYIHPFDSSFDGQLKEDDLTMHTIYTVKDVMATGQILLDIGILHHEPEYFKMFDRKDKTAVISGITQVKRDLARKGHEWISLLSVK